MMSSIKLALVAVAVAILAGCAHPIVIAPDIAALNAPATALTSKKAGYFISNENRALEVTTPGGGGDNIRYFPYRDLETGLYRILSGSFGSIVKLDAAPSAESMRSQGIAYAITPTITTQSSSDGLFTWPPTAFTVDLECRILGDGGTEVSRVRVVGTGAATFSEFKSDFPLAAKRASTDALNKLSIELGKLDAIKK